ncbi:MAG: DUF4345 family protein [Myxococcota bacterium]|nr:DUF4345 family protein [Myxococcota bacterium]
MESFARGLLALLAVINLGFALWIVNDPYTVAEALSLVPAGPDAGAELRAMYGGLVGGLGWISLLGAIKPSRRLPALWANGWSFAGIGIVRILACLSLQLWSAQLIYALFELCAAGVCLALLRRLER